MDLTFEISEDELDLESQEASLKELEAMDAGESTASSDADPLEFNGDAPELLKMMAKMLRGREAEVMQLFQIVSDKSKSINELLIKNTQLQADLHIAQKEAETTRKENDKLQEEAALLRAEIQLLRRKEIPYHSYDPTAANRLQQHTTETIRTEYQKGIAEATSDMARQATQLPPIARATSTSKQHRQKEAALDWELFDALVQKDNKMSELNNDRAKVFLNALHMHHIIDEKFHARKNITNNVVCFIAKELHRRIPTSIKWEIFSHLFKRNAIRTYDGKDMKPADRRLVRELTALFDSIEEGV